MDNQHVAGLVVGAFVLGGVIAETRMKRHYQKIINKLTARQGVNAAKTVAMATLYSDVNEGIPLDEAMYKFNETREFIDLIDKEF